MTKAKKATVKSKDLKQVQDHYLDYPYPHRNPEDEKTRLLRIYGDYLGEINHWLFEGKKEFKKGFRVLIAGGGTGDSTVYLAEQLKDTDADIVYLDFSKNSMKIAQERAKNRGLKNITWINDSILNIPDLKLGKFDYIQCSGVLHHLENPDAGLKALSDSLTDDGGMGIMVYAQYGRTAVYQIQDIMKMVNEGVESRQEEVKNGWEVMNNLPATNWYNRGKDLLSDHISHGDVGMYDMFLHKQDRAYTVPQIYDFVEKAKLNFVEFQSAHSRAMLNIARYIKDPVLLKRLQKMDKSKQQAMCEIMCGSIIKHSFYVSKKKKPVAKLTNLDNVPYIYTVPNVPKQVSDYLAMNKNLIGSHMQFSWKSDFLGDTTIYIPVSQYTEHLFRHMISESKSLKEIFQGIEKDMGKKIKDTDLMGEVNRIFPLLEEVGVLLLRNKKISIVPMK
ncbi:MAG: class I SAM-dependent methyltransferase [Rickettsiaceae bacterium]|nr:class I SAM-dependent methyltransferase [Rickettsiaceae bacterium]MDP4832725.1 class I SAM-dependent methyltransferase [Rickettsiaceae bacterium]MDP5020507.1 class I SAM-dependent methyltransferase [Rickettsiaceae bacterium]MDP5083680.1 class I SAM-dependent methyltransferase [Rickettsiaceae bacterium]